MPRSGRGGRREGVAGKAYGQRQDLNAPKLAVAAAPGQQYGARKAQEDAQRSVPMGSPPVPRPASTPPAGAPEGVPAAGGLGDLFAPTARPGEPVTAGADAGAGPGMAALGPSPQDMERSEDLKALLPYLPALEAMAARPNATKSTRTFVRRVKGAM